MSNFCGNCGLPLDGRSHCVRCAHVVVPVLLGSATDTTGHALLPSGSRPALVPSPEAAAVRRARDIEDGDTRARPARPRPVAAVAPAGGSASAGGAQEGEHTVRRLSSAPPAAGAASVMPGRPASVAPHSSAPLGQPHPGMPPVVPMQPGARPGPPAQARAHAPRPQSPARPARAIALVNPLRRMPAADMWRDLTALLLLVLSVLAPWTAADRGADLWWAWASIALAASGLVLPHLMISRLFPAFRPSHSVVAKTVMALPVLAAALLAVVGGLLEHNPVGGSGVGVGVALALAGAVLVVQPRAVEEVLGPQREGLWANAGHVVALLAVGLQVLAVAVHVGRGAESGAFTHDDFTFWLQLIVVGLVFPLAILGVPAVQFAMARTAGRRVLAVTAWTVLGVTALAGLQAPGFASLRTVETWESLTGGTFLVGAAGALALSRASARRTGMGVDPATGWLQTARLALALAGVGGAASTAVSLSALTEFNAPPGSGVASTVIVALAALVCVCACLLLLDLRRRVVAAVLAGIAAGLGAVCWVLGLATDWAVVAAGGLTPFEAVSLVVLPASAAIVLTVPPSVRASAVRPQPQVAWGPPRAVPTPHPPHVAASRAQPAVGAGLTRPAAPIAPARQRLPQPSAPTQWSGWAAQAH